jgi:hypothetical protein
LTTSWGAGSREPGAGSREPGAGSSGDTVRARRRVAVIARTPAAVNRLWDVVPLIAEDLRIATVFVVDTGSTFSTRLTENLTALGIKVLTWDDAVRQRFDLAIAASDNSDLALIDAPVLLTPHGVGYHRHSAAEPNAISGIRRSALVRDDQIVPNTLVVAHDDQLAVVEAVEPRLLARTLVAGDPGMDRIAASAARHDDYHRAFDPEGRDLITICSTWGEHSLFGQHSDLPARIVTSLPRDRYVVALVLHPNVWTRHGKWAIDHWLRLAVEAGLIVIPHEEGWRAAIVASSLVISDHGSLTCYSAGAGRTVLLAADGGPEVVVGSPMDKLRQHLPRLRVDEPLHAQISQALALPPVPSNLVQSIFARPGQAAALLRARMYEILNLREPAWNAYARPVPVPQVTRTEPDALLVQVHATDNSLTLQRFPLVWGVTEQVGRRHIAVSEYAADPELLERAAVVWSAHGHDEPDAAVAWARRTLLRWPGASIAVTSLGGAEIVAVTRAGVEIRAEATVSRSVAGSALHWWSRHGEGRELAVNGGVVRVTRAEAC